MASRTVQRPNSARTAISLLALETTLAAGFVLVDPTTTRHMSFWLVGVLLATVAALLPDVIRGAIVLTLSVLTALALVWVLALFAYLGFDAAPADFALFAFVAGLVLGIAKPCFVGRLLSPLLALALTAVVAALVFYQHNPPADGTTLTAVIQPQMPSTPAELTTVEIDELAIHALERYTQMLWMGLRTKAAYLPG